MSNSIAEALIGFFVVSEDNSVLGEIVAIDHIGGDMLALVRWDGGEHSIILDVTDWTFYHARERASIAKTQNNQEAAGTEEEEID